MTSIREELEARWRWPQPTPHERSQLNRKYSAWIFAGISEDGQDILIRLYGRDGRFIQKLSENREKLRGEKIDMFSRRENLRSREDPGISGDLDAYDDLIVGRYEKKPAQRRRPNSASFAAPIDGAARGVPQWIKLIPGGRIDCRDDRGPFQMADPEQVIQATHEFEMLHDAGLPIDLNHSTDIAAKTGGEAPAVGWIRDLQARAGDLYGRVEWTAKGLAAVSRGPNGEPPAYRYISPVFAYDPKTLAVLQLLRAGLTNNPNLFRSAICTRQSRENTYDLSTVELAVARSLGISAHTFAAARRTES